MSWQRTLLLSGCTSAVQNDAYRDHQPDLRKPTHRTTTHGRALHRTTRLTTILHIHSRSSVSGHGCVSRRPY
ncbi:uncharacterized protein TRAVEDRAFT_56154 [Trametes versicolor FP-101664 SS1]|uniref:uncharacterized protein n=1 Tax=Trametes versicolor (strain FP-101664) TaxID=717944 RepID=UPI000462129D|nr:uncharacterized protein TRAVEDRAFT_56154 [Trametes versicolor FP-101664 SS1]EIW62937.1 hypothetical protein TRAVEDRAFT_56154 [Trametes versicolor FP-101664 SS1]